MATNDNTTQDQSRNSPTTFSFAASEDGDAVTATVTHEDASDQTQARARAMLDERSSLQEKILALAEHQGIAPHIIDLPTPMSFNTDENGDRYIEDMNSVIRYYPDEEAVYPTRDFIGTEKVDESTQRVTDIETMYNTA